MSSPPTILVLAAHPDLRHSRVNRALMQTGQSFDNVTVRDLYALYPDHVIDVPAEQALAAQADLIVWLHPIHWYSMPPLMKLWLDEVLALNWAYGPGGNTLRGKDLWLVATTGGTEDAYSPQGYNRYFFDAFLPLVLHGAHVVPRSAVEAHVEVYRNRLSTYPNWPEMDELDACPMCEVPVNDRPSEGA
jgi:glutathione-regulated potassium-efflux system ancillary protein KefF